EELAARDPGGVHYATLRLEDGVTFMHLFTTDSDDAANTLGGIAAFSEFLRNLPQRCAEPPIAQPVTVVGSYRMFGGTAPGREVHRAGPSLALIAVTPIGRARYNRAVRLTILVALVLVVSCGQARPVATTSSSVSSPRYEQATATPSVPATALPPLPASAPRTNPPPEPSPTPQTPDVQCSTGTTPAAMALISGVGGTFIYDVTDPVHPQAVCRIAHTSARILTGTSFEYLVPHPNGTTDVVLHSFGSNSETVAATFRADLWNGNIESPFASVAWYAAPKVIGYSTDGGTDANGQGVTDVWVATTTAVSKLYS